MQINFQATHTNFTEITINSKNNDLQFLSK